MRAVTGRRRDMRVVHIVSTFPPYKGGMGNVAREIAERTARRGHAVMVVTPRRVESGEWRVESDRKSETITYHLSPINSVLRFGNAAWCPGIARMLDALHHDLVHLHWPFIGGVAPVLAWRRRNPNRRLIVQYHMDLLASGWRGIVFAAYQRITLPRVLRVADHVVVSSLDYAQHGALAPFMEALRDRISEIPLGVDIERFAPSRRTNDDRSPFHAFFVGGLDRAHAFKGVPVLLSAIARVPELRLRIVGDGDLRSAYERRTHDLGIADRVEFLGAVSDAELPEIYRSADVLVLPSTARSEAFGIVLLEAGASGIPVIASDLPGVRSVVVDGATGLLVPPGDAAALAERLAMLARDHGRARRMGAAGRDRVVARYDWERVVNRWVEEYHNVCGS